MILFIFKDFFKLYFKANYAVRKCLKLTDRNKLVYGQLKVDSKIIKKEFSFFKLSTEVSNNNLCILRRKRELLENSSTSTKKHLEVLGHF